MIILHGKEKKNMNAEEFVALAAKFSRVVIDVGTGDGKNVYKNGKSDPDTLYVGLDAAAENMRKKQKQQMKLQLLNNAGHYFRNGAGADPFGSGDQNLC